MLAFAMIASLSWFSLNVDYRECLMGPGSAYMTAEDGTEWASLNSPGGMGIHVGPDFDQGSRQCADESPLPDRLLY